jgi:uncharacterized sulfatase
MIVADDQSYQDFGFMGNELVCTPHIDRLAARSARYPHGYVPTSVCRPSLATLLTGLYPHQHGIHFNHPPPGLQAMRQMTAEQYWLTRSKADYLIENVPTLPQILARHGYACLQTGKHWEADFQTAGFTHGMTRGRPADRLSQITGTRQQANGQWVAHGNGDAGLVIGRETLQPITDFVDEHAGRRPFFVWYAPFLPHAPFDAPDRFRRLYRGRGVPEYLLAYYAEIARFDATVGELMGYLQRKRLLENTLVVLVSDNGFRPTMDGRQRHDARSKLSPYEDGLRTPILIRWEGHTQSAEHPQPVHTIDLLPTIVSAIGLASEVTSRMHGRNLMPSAMGRTVLESQPVFGAIYPNDAVRLGHPADHVRGRWMRNGRYKLIVAGRGPRSLKRALFDLVQDPREQVNLAHEPLHSDRVADMASRLDNWWAAGDNSRVMPSKTTR